MPTACQSVTRAGYRAHPVGTMAGVGLPKQLVVVGQWLRRALMRRVNPESRMSSLGPVPRRDRLWAPGRRNQRGSGAGPGCLDVVVCRESSSGNARQCARERGCVAASCSSSGWPSVYPMETGDADGHGRDMDRHRRVVTLAATHCRTVGSSRGTVAANDGTPVVRPGILPAISSSPGRVGQTSGVRALPPGYLDVAREWDRRASERHRISLSTTMSAIAPTVVVTAGRPCRIASSRTRGKASRACGRQREQSVGLRHAARRPPRRQP